MSKPPTFEVSKPGDHTKALKILIYSGTGGGKTFLAGSAAAVPEMGKVLFLMPDPGDLTLGAAGFDCDVKHITEFEEYNPVYEYLASDDNQYGTVVVDGLTDSSELCMFGIMRSTKEANPDKDVDLPGIDQHGKNSNRLRKLVRHYRDLPVHVIMTALEKEIKDEALGKMYLRPSMPGKLSNEVGAYFDIIIYIEAKLEDADPDTGKKHPKPIVVRYARFQPTDRILAKDRTRKLGVIMRDPTMAKILAMINDPKGELTAAPGAEPVIKFPKIAIAAGKK